MPHLNATPAAAAPMQLRPVVFTYICASCETQEQHPVPVLPADWLAREADGALSIHCPDCAAHLPTGDVQ